MPIDWKRTGFILFAAAAGLFAGLYGQPFIHGNERAISVIVNVFSILAGFLVAVMTIMGDPTGFVSRSWRHAEQSRPNIYNKLSRQKYLFILYLLVLLLISVQSLIEKKYPAPAAILEQIYFGGAVFAFILSMGLPTALMKIQMARHDELVEFRRRDAGIKK
jgi:hypothetical protein